MEKEMRGKRTGILILMVFAFTCLYAQDPGTLKWAFETGDQILSSPAIGSDGTIYVGSYDKNLYAINPDGTQKWAFKTGDLVLSSPAIGLDGTIYVGSYDYNLYAVNPDGTQKWAFDIGERMHSPPAIDADGTVYIGSHDNNLHAVNPDGTQKWQFNTGYWIFSSPTIAADGIIYIGSYDNNLYALHPDGTQKWMFETGDDIYSSQAIGSDGTVYVGSVDDKLYALNPDGTKKWMFKTGGHVYSSPAIGSDGTIYIGSYDNNLYAFNADGTKRWMFETGDEIRSSPAIGSDGTIYVASKDNYLYAVYSSSTCLADSPWPRYHQNNRNTGRYSYMNLLDNLSFHFIPQGQSVQKEVTFNNFTDQNIILNSCTMSSNAYSLVSALPVTVAAQSSAQLTVTITPDEIDLYQCNCQLAYENNGNTGTLSGLLQAGIFPEDQSEQAIIAKKAYDTYVECAQAEGFRIAKQNNLGILYRFLGSYSTAEQVLQSNLTMAQDANYGYAGIKMNCGVVQSDLDADEEAVTYYSAAWQDVCLADSSTSALAPQILYNQAWEYYKSGDDDNALISVNRTINHGESTDWILAKSYVLRGAIKVSQGDVADGEADFNQAIVYDPDGPIGELAADNLWTGVEDDPSGMPGQFILLPNYPNPFNPETVIEFGLPEAGVVEAAVYNVLGEKVRTIVSAHYGVGWHRLTWQGTDDAGRPAGSGIYLLKIRTGDKVLTGKMSLLR